MIDDRRRLLLRALDLLTFSAAWAAAVLVAGGALSAATGGGTGLVADVAFGCGLLCVTAATILTRPRPLRSERNGRRRRTERRAARGGEPRAPALQKRLAALLSTEPPAPDERVSLGARLFGVGGLLLAVAVGSTLL